MAEKKKKPKKEETDNELVRRIAEQKYEFGFTTNVQTEIIEKGLNEDVVRLISAKKNEPEWLLEFRLKAFRHWLTMKQPDWAHVTLPEIDYQGISYYADPMAQKPKGDGTIDPELEKTFDKLGIPLEERLALSGNTAVDAIMDSVSVKTTFKEKLAEMGVIFRRLICLYPEGRALSDGTQFVFPHQRPQHGTVRAHAHRGRRRQLCQLSRRLHGTDA